jgi:hypothetical protein
MLNRVNTFSYMLLRMFEHPKKFINDHKSVSTRSNFLAFCDLALSHITKVVAENWKIFYDKNPPRLVSKNYFVEKKIFET